MTAVTETGEVRHVLRRIDEAAAAELKHVSGVLDLRARRPVAGPAGEWRRRAVHPELLGFAVPGDGYSV